MLVQTSVKFVQLILIGEIRIHNWAPCSVNTVVCIVHMEAINYHVVLVQLVMQVQLLQLHVLVFQPIMVLLEQIHVHHVKEDIFVSDPIHAFLHLHTPVWYVISDWIPNTIGPGLEVHTICPANNYCAALSASATSCGGIQESAEQSDEVTDCKCPATFYGPSNTPFTPYPMWMNPTNRCWWQW